MSADDRARWLEDSVRSEVQRTTASLTALGDQLADVVLIDEKTGAVQIDAGEFRKRFVREIGSRWAEPFADLAATYAAGGMAVLGPLEERGHAVAMPWMTIEDVVWRLRGAPPDLCAALGVKGAKTGRDASELLRLTHPGIPDDVFPPPLSELLTKNPAGAMAGRQPNGLPEPPDATRPSSGPVGGPATGVARPAARPIDPSALQAAECLLNGSWGGWWDGFGGWVPGFRVCLDQNCAAVLGNLLINALEPGWISLSGAIYRLLTQGRGAAVAGLMTALGVGLSLVGMALGWNILLVNGPNGVCIFCSWPYTGGIIFWAAPA
jgi:hypothetical protein